MIRENDALLAVIEAGARLDGALENYQEPEVIAALLTMESRCAQLRDAIGEVQQSIPARGPAQ